eukprot:COSAG02_NODE_1974_length_10214_cov_6.852694_9_plen_152_part_00
MIIHTGIVDGGPVHWRRTHVGTVREEVNITIEAAALVLTGLDHETCGDFSKFPRTNQLNEWWQSVQEPCVLRNHELDSSRLCLGHDLRCLGEILTERFLDIDLLNHSRRVSREPETLYCTVLHGRRVVSRIARACQQQSQHGTVRRALVEA